MTNAALQARTLASSIVTIALELEATEADGALHETLLAEPSVQAAMPRALVNDAASQRALLSRLAIRLARDVLEVWRAHYPDQHGPEEAVRAAEEWATCPCALHAEAAAATAACAAQQAQSVWRQPPKAAAWAGRTAAWAADAPKYGWQAVATIIGGCRATSSDRVVAAAQTFLSNDGPGTLR